MQVQENRRVRLKESPMIYYQSMQGDLLTQIQLSNLYGWSPLFVASLFGHAEVVEMLISKGASVNDKDIDGLSPLYVASREGHAGMTKCKKTKKKGKTYKYKKSRK